MEERDRAIVIGVTAESYVSAFPQNVRSARWNWSIAIFLAVAWGPNASSAQKLKDSDCLACHSDASLSAEGPNGSSQSLYVNQDKFKHSVHGSMLSCVDCHKDVKSLTHDQTPGKVSCADCHADAQAAYLRSTHAKASKTGKNPAATCVDCHGDAHQIVTGGEPKSPVNHLNIPSTCGRCHGQLFLMQSNGESAQPFISYQSSIHGRAVANGSEKAAVCTDCHGSHEILSASAPGSPISKTAVGGTCGKCHADVAGTFNASIHGEALARGNALAPNCTDCHGIHSIKPHADPQSPVAKQNVSRDICARCHEGVRLSQEFGVPGNRVASYFDSYHGLAAEGGSMVAANCSSCHGVHNILPSRDPRSTINRANLEATCGKCHKGVTQKFTLTRVHLGADRANDVGSVAVRWVRWIYVGLIVLVIGGMFLHNFIIWRHKAVQRRSLMNPFMTRMTENQRWQHMVLLSSFIVLVVTGFALKFPDSWFAEALGMGEHVRSIVHRVAGVILIAAGLYHIVYVMVTREGRRLIRDFAPRPKDVVDVFGTMRYYLGLSSEKPKFGRFSYAEKAEYWALVWGTVLMGVTGIMLWANVWFGDLLARWWIDVATAIHFYEAILATLAILVWHFYQIFFDPDVYPMNWAWWDGKMPVEQYRHEHGLDSASLEDGSGDDRKPE